MTPTSEERAREIVWRKTVRKSQTLEAEIASAIREAEEAEREACAKTADDLAARYGVMRSMDATNKRDGLREVAAAIRARGKS